jgi:hypothetical protein
VHLELLFFSCEGEFRVWYLLARIGCYGLGVKSHELKKVNVTVTIRRNKILANLTEMLRGAHVSHLVINMYNNVVLHYSVN